MYNEREDAMRRTKEEAQQTKEAVLEAALQVFSEKGYAAATLNEIAARAAVTRGAIYWHFNNKAELYNTLLLEASSTSAQVVEQAAGEGGELPEILRRIFIRLLNAVEQDPRLRATLELELFKTAQLSELEESRKQHLASGEELIAGIASVMQLGMQDGYLREDVDAVTMARSFIGFQNGMIRLWLMAPTAFSLKEEASALAEIYMQGVLA
jgi:TetR/AcrR family acrAB operon transcriptional repressor